MTTLQVLALEYAIAVYPLLLIVFTYLLVEMHDHNVRIVIWLWKPFHEYFVRFRKKSNVKGSLINSFATFLLISFVKFLDTSFAFLFPVNVYNIHGRSKRYLYYDGTVEYFGPEHLPFAILADAVVLVFNIFPLLLLLLYPWFISLYLMLRIAILMSYTINAEFSKCIAILILLVFLTAIFNPHKSPIHNITDTFLLLILIAAGILAQFINVEHYVVLQSIIPSQALTDTFLCILLLYFIAIILYKIFAHKRFVRKAHQKLCLIIPCNCQPVNNEVPCPDRLVNAEEYAPLLTTETLANE